MLIFDQLRISDDSQYMFIDVHINKAEYFNNMYIESITIASADKVLETNPLEPTNDYLFKLELEENVKELSLVLTPNDFIKTWEKDASAIKFLKSDMSKTLFFVYVKCKGIPDECTPCQLDEDVTLGVVFDETMLYQKAMGYTKDLLNDCSLHQNFIDFILLWNAFKASIETEHYKSAVKFWNILFEDSITNTSSAFNNKCNCL